MASLRQLLIPPRCMWNHRALCQDSGGTAVNPCPWVYMEMGKAVRKCSRAPPLHTSSRFQNVGGLWVSWAILKELDTQRNWDELRKVLGHKEDYFSEMIPGRHAGPHQAVDGLWVWAWPQGSGFSEMTLSSPCGHPRSHPLILSPSYLLQLDASINTLSNW